MARTRAAERARAATARGLLDGARAVFVAKGYPRATIADIVRAAGVTQGVFYLYFRNKADIFAAILDQYRQLIIAEVFDVDLTAVRTSVEWLDLADRISDFLVEHVRAHGDFTRLFIAEAPTIGSGFLQEARATSAGIIAEIGRILNHGVQSGLLRELDVEVAALAVFGALKEAIHQCCMGEGPERVEVLVPRVIRTFATLFLK